MDTIDMKMIEKIIELKVNEACQQILLSIPYSLHEDKWGVPCGPTLVMIQPSYANEIHYIDTLPDMTRMTVAQYNAYLRQKETFHTLTGEDRED